MSTAFTPPCRNSPDAFFRKDGERERDAQTRVRDLASRYCAHCPITDTCRAKGAALKAEGLWGGDWRYRDSTGRLHVLPMMNHEATGGLVPAGPIVAHLKRLVDQGASQASIARTAAVSTAAVSTLLAGKRKRVQVNIANALLAVGGPR